MLSPAHGPSFSGIPVYLFEIRHLDSKTISTYEKTGNITYSKAKLDGQTSPRLLRLFALYENLTRFAQPLCTQMPDREHATITPITLSTNVVDVSGVSLRQFWNLKSHMQAASTLATAHYPETLDREWTACHVHLLANLLTRSLSLSLSHRHFCERLTAPLLSPTC